MINKPKWLGMLMIVFVFGFLVVDCENGTTDANPDPPTGLPTGSRIGTITVTGLYSYIDNYLQVYVFPDGGSAVGSSPWGDLTKILNPTVTIDFYPTEHGTFNPNGTYSVRLWIYQTNSISGNCLTAPTKTNIEFKEGFATISF